jgi:uncharacterized membrane protein
VDVKTVSLSAVFASLYAVLVIFLAPISSGPIQLRVADCLLPLAALFGWPIIWGATLGCLVGNAVGGMIAFGSLNPFDVVFGSVANFLATLMIFAFRKRKLLGCVLASLIVGAIVGGYLWIFVPPPDIFGVPLQPWTAMVVSITLSSLVAIAVIGYVLLVAISQPNVIEPIKSRGLKVYT